MITVDATLEHVFVTVQREEEFGTWGTNGHEARVHGTEMTPGPTSFETPTVGER